MGPHNDQVLLLSSDANERFYDMGWRHDDFKFIVQDVSDTSITIQTIDKEYYQYET